MWKKFKAFYKNYSIIVIAIILYVILNFIAEQYKVVGQVISSFISLISPFFVGFGFAFLLVKPMRFIEFSLLKLIKNQKFVRSISALLTILLAILSVVGIVLLIAPQLLSSILSLNSILKQVNQSANQILLFLKNTYNIDIIHSIESVSQKDLAATLLNSGLNPSLVITSVFSMSAGTLRFIINLLISIICALYLLIDQERFLKNIKKVNYALFEKQRADLNVEIVLLARDIFNNFIIGKIIDSIIIGILCYIGMIIFRFEYALLISVFIGITNVIPVFGPFIGGIPGVIILFILNPVQGLWFALFVFVLQQFDGNILGPYILGDKLGLPSLGILISVVVGGGLFGFLGMLLGVPVFALFYELSKRKINQRLKEKNIEMNES